MLLTRVPTSERILESSDTISLLIPLNGNEDRGFLCQQSLDLCQRVQALQPAMAPPQNLLDVLRERTIVDCDTMDVEGILPTDPSLSIH